MHQQNVCLGESHDKSSNTIPPMLYTARFPEHTQKKAHAFIDVKQQIPSIAGPPRIS